MSLPVVVLAGGLATRLRPVTERIPKSLIEVAGRPFAEHQIELLRAHGLTDIMFLTGYLGEQLPAQLGDGSRWGVKLRYLADGAVPLGTGGAIRAALQHLAPTFFVLYGDSYLPCDYAAVARAFAVSEAAALMTVYPNDGRWDASNVDFDNGRIVAYDKQRRTPQMRHIDYGLGAFRRDVFASWSLGTAFDLAEVYQRVLADDDLAGYEVGERFYEIGSPAGLADTSDYLRAHPVVAVRTDA